MCVILHAKSKKYYYHKMATMFGDVTDPQQRHQP